MTLARSILVSVVAVGLVVTLSRATLGHEAHEGHESHSRAEHGSHHEGEHEAHHEEHREGHREEGHREEHHEAHHDDHRDEHREAHHDEHHEAHHDEHRDEHHDAHHDDHHDEHHGHDDHHDFDHKDWYKHAWWHHQPSWHHQPWQHWWHRPTTHEVAAWSAGLGLSAPIYYDYGQGGNVVYRNNEVYVNGAAVGTADSYAKSAVALANASPATDTTNDQPGQWLPLGTFAVLQDEGGSKPSQTLQLALGKDGSISGVLFDLSKDTSTPIRGWLERATQRVAFDLGAKSGLVAETGLYNLTRDKVTLLVHHGDGKPQTYTLVRFQSPPGGGEEKGIVLSK